MLGGMRNDFVVVVVVVGGCCCSVRAHEEVNFE
jgi:hypothetical protein